MNAAPTSASTDWFFDTTRITKKHDDALQRSSPLQSNLAAINSSLELLFQLLCQETSDNQDHRTLALIGLRVLNATGAAMTLGRHGFFVHAFAVARDLMELAFLVDFFQRWPEEVIAWRTLTERDRRRKFSPLMVRKRLDAADGFSDQNRNKSYTRLSNYAAHASPQSVQLLQQNGNSPLGPQPNEQALNAVLEEVCLHLIPAVDCFCRLPWLPLCASDPAVIEFRKQANYFIDSRRAAQSAQKFSSPSVP